MTLFILILTVALYVLRPTEWSGDPTLRLNLILNIVGAVAVIFSLMSAKEKKPPNTSLTFLCALFIWMLISSIWHGQFSAISGYTTTMLTNVVVVALMFFGIRSLTHAKTVALSFAALLLFVAFQCHLQVTTGVNIAGVEPFRRLVGYAEDGASIVGYQARWIGVFNDPNDTGMLLVSLAPFAFALSFFGKQKIPIRAFWGLVFAALTYAIYLTNSRGTYLALVAAIGMFFVIKHRSVIGLVLSGVVGAIFLVLGPARMSTVTSGDNSAMERVYAWIEALELFAMYPVFGVGPGQWMNYHHLTTHNSYVLAVVELGFPGYALYLSIFLVALYVSAQVAMRTEDIQVRITAAGLFSCMVGVMVSAFFISRTYVLTPFFVAAFVTAFSRELSPAIYQSAIGTLRFRWLGAFAAASVVFIWLTNRLSTQLML